MFVQVHIPDCGMIGVVLCLFRLFRYIYIYIKSGRGLIGVVLHLFRYIYIYIKSGRGLIGVVLRLLRLFR